MSGVEIPGLAIGGVSLLFQVFAGCIDGYKFIADAAHAQTDCYALLVEFKLQETRLINWAKHVKMDYSDEHLTFNHMSRALVIDVMEQQRTLLFQFRDLKEKKKLDKFAMPFRTGTAIQHTPTSKSLLDNGGAPSNDRAITNGDSEASTGNKAVKFPPTEIEEIVQKAFNYLSQVRHVPQKLQWAAFHSEKFGRLVEKLAALNTTMLEALGQGQMETLISLHKRTDYQILAMNDRLEQVAKILQSQLLIKSRHQSRITELYDSEFDELDRQIVPSGRRPSLGVLARSKARNQIMEGSVIEPEFARYLGLPQPDDTDNIRNETELSIDDIVTRSGEPLRNNEEAEDDSRRTEAIYKDTSIWIEWKVLDPAPPMNSAGPESKVEERIKNLTALLMANGNADEEEDPYQFRAPHCLGYFYDEDYGRYGLVFKKPQRASTAPPETLHDLFTAKDEKGEPLDVPSLTDRIQLMRSISESIERLHAVDWLHKGLRSSNILFFRDPVSKAIDLSNPYISGFEYSRPAKRDDLTERPSDDIAADIYRHPFVQQNSNRGWVKKSHDLYSLGILLFEIAHWLPLDQILGIDLSTARPKEAYRVKDRLLAESRWLGSVRSHLGNTVEDIIRTCLEGPHAFLGDKYDDKSVYADVELQRAFGEKVVERLEQMKGI